MKRTGALVLPLIIAAVFWGQLSAAGQPTISLGPARVARAAEAWPTDRGPRPVLGENDALVADAEPAPTDPGPAPITSLSIVLKSMTDKIVIGQPGSFVVKLLKGSMEAVSDAEYKNYSITIRCSNKIALESFAQVDSLDPKNWQLVFSKAGSVNLKVTAEWTAAGKKQQQSSELYAVTVSLPDPKPVKSVVVQQATLSTVVGDTPFKIRVLLYAEGGERIAPEIYQKYGIAVTADNPAVPAPFPTDAAQSEWEVRIPAPLTRATFTAKAHLIDTDSGKLAPAEGALTVSTARITALDNLTVALDPVDDRTASYLYGRKVAEEYFIYKLALRNLSLSHKIIVYGPSIEVPVTFERQLDKSQHSKKLKPDPNGDSNEQAKTDEGKPPSGTSDRAWYPVEYPDLVSEYNEALVRLDDARLNGTKEEKETFRKQVEEVSRRQRQSAGNSLGSSLNPAMAKTDNALSENAVRELILRMLELPSYALIDSERTVVQSWLKDGNSLTGDLGAGDGVRPYGAGFLQLARADKIRVPSPGDQAILARMFRRLLVHDLTYLSHRLMYRPYSFDIMAQTVDPRDESSRRSIFLRALRFGTEVGSAVTGVPGLHAGATTSAIFDKIGNIAIPAIEKLWPSATERERQNLRENTMRDLEEVAPGGQIVRMMFFPRREFRGFIRGYRTRIAEVHTNYINIRVGVVADEQQGGVAASGSAPAPGQ